MAGSAVLRAPAPRLLARPDDELAGTGAGFVELGHAEREVARELASIRRPGDERALPYVRLGQLSISAHQHLVSVRDVEVAVVPATAAAVARHGRKERVVDRGANADLPRRNGIGVGVGYMASGLYAQGLGDTDE